MCDGYAHQQDDDWPNSIIDALKLDLNNELELTGECLDLYSKDQLQKLAKQAKIADLTRKTRPSRARSSTRS